MGLSVADIIKRASYILQDDSNHYWSKDELLLAFNDGRIEMYNMRPDIYVERSLMSLNAGHLQSLPADSRTLFAVISNESAPRKREITIVEHAVLARHRPNWRSLRPSNEIKHYLYDERDGSSFEVYPPAVEGTLIVVSFAKAPEPLGIEQAIEKEVNYLSALVDYVLYRAFQKESDTDPMAMQRSQTHYQNFHRVVISDVQAKLEMSPNQAPAS